jgi:hypothetical protein
LNTNQRKFLVKINLFLHKSFIITKSENIIYYLKENIYSKYFLLLLFCQILNIFY